jgi:hypothetical protein
MRHIRFLASLSFIMGLCVPAMAQQPDSLTKELLFHASFDKTGDADFGFGDKHLWHSPTMDKRDDAKRGVPSEANVVIDSSSGKFGGAVRFKNEKGPMVFYRVEGNFPEPVSQLEGTVSFWLRTDPAGELRDGFCDPIQITSKQWDDASFFVEFEKRPSGIPFRLGVYADKPVWNPMGRKFETIPAEERPLATVTNPPFSAKEWTHVAFSFQGFNESGTGGIATLYLNGEKRGELKDRPQVFTWDIKKAAIMLGLNYVGSMDDLAIFRRALSDNEIKALYSLPKGVSSLTSR